MKKKSNVILGRSFILQDLCNFARSGNYTMGHGSRGRNEQQFIIFLHLKGRLFKGIPLK